MWTCQKTIAFGVLALLCVPAAVSQEVEITGSVEVTRSEAAPLKASAGMIPNQLPGLVPPSGAWRGSTHWKPPNGPYDPLSYVDEFGKPLHIYRTFKTEANHYINAEEKAFVAAGGILLVSIQPHNWKDVATSPAYTHPVTGSLHKIAVSIKNLAPAKVMMLPGYEPDGHADESQENKAVVYGTIAEFLAMRKAFVDAFNAAGVTNAVWVMDYSNDCGLTGHACPYWSQLYPKDGSIQWVMFNMFQQKAPSQGEEYAFPSMFGRMYQTLVDGEKQPNLWGNIPWAVGAWGTRSNQQGYFKDGKKQLGRVIPARDRENYIIGFTEALNSGKYPKIKASIAFDALYCIITTDAYFPGDKLLQKDGEAKAGSQMTEFATGKDIAPTFLEYLSATPFIANDHLFAYRKGRVNSITTATQKQVELQGEYNVEDTSALRSPKFFASVAVPLTLALVALMVVRRRHWHSLRDDALPKTDEESTSVVESSAEYHAY